MATDGFSNKLDPSRTNQIRLIVTDLIVDAPREFYGRATGDADVFKITIQRNNDVCSIVSVNGEYAGLPQSVIRLKRTMTEWSDALSR